MAAALIWSSESLDDIDAIAQFIARDSLQHAQSVVDGLFDPGESIVTHPLAGRVVPEWRDAQVRERFLYSLSDLRSPSRPASRCWRCCMAGACSNRSGNDLGVERGRRASRQ